MNIHDTLKQSRDGVPLNFDQTVALLALAPDCAESYQIMAEARRITQELTGNKAEIHGQIALNLAPCSANCKFCSFATVNKIFSKSTKISAEEAVLGAKLFEEQGANAIYLMATEGYRFGEILEMGREVRCNIKGETLLIANVGDRTLEEARQMKEAGYNGVYHALRMREGDQTGIDPQARIASFKAFKEAGLVVGTCVEPIGPEHTGEEIAERIHFAASLEPAFSGAMRRISIPGTELAQKYGMVSELRMAQIVAVTRLATPRSVIGNCTHEPAVSGAMGGANLFWAEIGANPRDVKEKTEEGRGFTVKKCRELFSDSECGVLEGPSAFYRR